MRGLGGTISVVSNHGCCYFLLVVSRKKGHLLAQVMGQGQKRDSAQTSPPRCMDADLLFGIPLCTRNIVDSCRDLMNKR